MLNNDDCSGLPPSRPRHFAGGWQAAGGLLSTLLCPESLVRLCLEDVRSCDGVVVSQACCMLVGNRKAPTVRFRYRSDRDLVHVVHPAPRGGCGGTRSTPRRWRLGEGPPEETASTGFAVSAPPEPVRARRRRLSPANPRYRTLEDPSPEAGPIHPAPCVRTAIPPARAHMRESIRQQRQDWDSVLDRMVDIQVVKTPG